MKALYERGRHVTKRLTVCFLWCGCTGVKHTQRSHKLIKADHVILLGVKQLKNLQMSIALGHSSGVYVA